MPVLVRRLAPRPPRDWHWLRALPAALVTSVVASEMLYVVEYLLLVWAGLAPMSGLGIPFILGAIQGLLSAPCLAGAEPSARRGAVVGGITAAAVALVMVATAMVMTLSFYLGHPTLVDAALDVVKTGSLYLLPGVAGGAVAGWALARLRD